MATEKERQKIQRASDSNGTSTVTFEFPNMLLKRVNKRMAKRKINNLTDYFISLVFLDIDN